MSTHRSSAVQTRLAQLRASMHANHLDALLITAPENRQYFTGFATLDHEAGSVLITADQVVLLTDQRYSEQAREEVEDIQVSDRRDTLGALVLDSLKQFGWESHKGTAKPTLGIESDHLTVAQYEELRKKGTRYFRLRGVAGMGLQQRAVKDSHEIALTQRATEITEQTFMHLLEYLRQPDLTEAQVAAEIIATFLRLGADMPAFSSIVAAGPNGARPHAVPGDRKLLPGQPIVIDMGARYQGYCADMTRTVFIDEVPPIWAERYNQVLAAQEACERGLHAGITGRDADALTRNVLQAAGMAEYFTHSTGHGTGLQIHELPNLSVRATEATLPVGAIVTIEPGVYFPGEGGIRIEDAAVITQTGCDVLTHAPKDLDSMIVRRQPQRHTPVAAKQR